MARKWFGPVVLASVAVAATMISISCASGEHEDERDEAPKMTLDQTPPAVRDAIQHAAGNATVTKVEKEDEDGRSVYEAKYSVDGVKHTVSVTPEGMVVELEEVVAPANVPPAVSAALAKAGGSVGKVEKSTDASGKSVYEADVTMNGKTHEVKVNPDGSMAGNKEEDDEEDEKH